MNRTAATNELVSVMSGIKRSLHGRTYHCSDGTTLNSGQLGLLFALKQHGPITAQDIAAKLAMTPGAVSQLVESLAEGGYITRTARSTDRRSFDLALSERGVEQVTHIEHQRHLVIKQMTDGLTDEELEHLVSTMQKMLETLQQHTK